MKNERGGVHIGDGNYIMVPVAYHSQLHSEAWMEYDQFDNQSIENRKEFVCRRLGELQNQTPIGDLTSQTNIDLAFEN